MPSGLNSISYNQFFWGNYFGRREEETALCYFLENRGGKSKQ